MSSRALRRAQREREVNGNASDEESISKAQSSRGGPKSSLFALLDQPESENEEEAGADLEEGDGSPEVKELEDMPPTKSSKKGKKKNKAREKRKQAKEVAKETNLNGLDEIDVALRDLSIPPAADGGSKHHRRKSQDFSVLSINSDHLHIENEVRRLFGRAALDTNEANDDELDPAAQAGRRQRRLMQQVQRGQRRNTPLNEARRKTFLVQLQPNETAPPGVSTGLAMEVLPETDDGTVRYRFVHAPAYRDVQLQFEDCVSSMDPERILMLLRFNPTHISTILQASLIVAHGRDFTLAGKLLQRALFTFGRALNSSFPNAASKGQARLPFRFQENRQFYLTAVMYMKNLRMRGVYRTIYEWAKLLLMLDPSDDPYAMLMTIDQHALRAKQYSALLDMSTHDHLEDTGWWKYPHIRYSRALAQMGLGDVDAARKSLSDAIKLWPFIAHALIKEQDISPVPMAVWGALPNTTYDELLTAHYVSNSKDLWASPEVKSLLSSVADGLTRDDLTPRNWSDITGGEPMVVPENISRLVILEEDARLLKLIPEQYRDNLGGMGDPLPPADNEPGYMNSSNRNVDVSPGDYNALARLLDEHDDNWPGDGGEQSAEDDE
ncbi:DUF654-domain-containing protein [Eremomyces bilateralis CBS 781.70]|uniref:DUF654-domain-containing protein n=1 Tax=Eremomyces bilateralis CBS 781.70 TaxID=1392243 RepID=A0A6G1G8U4_9PEZI|nr:DUF654-domain-containing protein [Eremomyces bilateralis CBS 781.70]KAF1814402.1 DUF654-domain-containing protein [Eremomyces bilateralis CBS 781.70]